MHPLAIPRVEAVVDLCNALGWFAEGDYRTSPCATEAELAWFHDAAYIAALRDATESGAVDLATRRRYGIGSMENPLFPGVFERASTSVGGSIRAAELALDGLVAFHPAGGTHHGRRARASGFCYFNDPVFAILRLLQAGLTRVAYVDLDAHHGDGVQDAFSDDPRVRTLSIHEAGRWPHTGCASDTGEGRACNLPVPAGCNDDELRLLIDDVILPLVSSFAPEAVVLTCGGDALCDDPLTKMALTNVALWDAIERIVPLAPHAVVLGGGGYNPWTLARYWTGLWGRLSGRRIPDALPVEGREILERLQCDLIDDEDMRPQWLTTLADSPTAAAVRPELRALRDEVLGNIDPDRWRAFASAPVVTAVPGTTAVGAAPVEATAALEEVSR
ncbi:MAG: acetoin utilization protein AcuC [Betaproteobacteria bacterium]|nr:acetoin utilization protein AcuC [Betaproteobacteria bacterium]MDE2003220.1 acetoin utilization protein AcuC [Betaproteobacteria bacterium]MDE2208185.1 acetoin utilization protein AcuC [Betaproteobacteria bacterium]